MLFRSTDQLKTLLDTIDTSNDVDVSEHLAALEAILAGNAPETPIEDTALSTEPEVQPAAIDGDSISSEALREFLVESYDNLEQLERDLITLEKDPASEPILRSVFRTIHTIKGTAGFLGFRTLESVTHVAENLLGNLRSGQLIMNTEIGGGLFTLIDAVRQMLAIVERTGTEGNTDYSQLIGQLTRLQTPTESEQPTAALEVPRVAPLPTVTPSIEKAKQPSAVKVEMPAAAGTAITEAAGGSAADSTIRVDVALLDKLMTRVGELVLARNQLLQFTSTLGDSSLHSTSQRLNLITTELQEGVMKTRMQPIGNVWSKFPRLVRDLAALCEKQVRIEMEGKETELDKTIIEAIKDPLTHLVRNTVDHGIERPEVRVANGKPSEGCLTLRAFHEGGQVNIEISDDGAGLNLERIKQKAIERGLIAAEQAARLTDREACQLIFLPGFSTAEKVSSVSGRGVGMDVVKTNIEKIGGTVDVQSQTGVGATIKIKIPLTLAIVPALIITSDGDRYAIPQVSLLELVRLENQEQKSDIEWIQDAPVYRLRGRLLPLVYLNRQLGVNALGDNVKNQSVVNIIVLRADDRQFGLVVDRINDSEEIVVKPLSKQLKGVSAYSGATIMGDGKVALILDVLGLAHRAKVISETRDRARSDNHGRDQERATNALTLLVMGVGKNRRLAMPLSMVARLENIDQKTLEHAAGHEVVQYRGEILPLIRLASVLNVEPVHVAAEEPLQVVVYTENSRSVGLVVDCIVDIMESTLDSQRPANNDSLTCSVVINDHVTDLIDLPAVIRRFEPSFYQDQIAI